MNAHLAGAVSQASSLPLNIGDAFGIDRTDPSDARMYDALIAMGSGSSGLGPLGDLYDNNEMQFMQLAQRIGPAYDFNDQDTDIAQQLVLAAHLINANLGIRVIDTELDGFDTHSDQLDVARDAAGPSRRRDRAVLRRARPALAQPGHDDDVLGVRSPARGRRRRAAPTTAPRRRCS